MARAHPLPPEAGSPWRDAYSGVLILLEENQELARVSEIFAQEWPARSPVHDSRLAGLAGPVQADTHDVPPALEQLCGDP